ncbi:DeoR family transcriptional regulator [Endozoicomonas acroporae]|uniref:DeoR family transcriptional regulator n=1 Tax=Endozoicomonas acroporae TaxID=1701104 RepID=UPI0013D6A1D9|nr:DeoR family transcriptional regulator [Endozoicomonas acroporae]
MDVHKTTKLVHKQQQIPQSRRHEMIITLLRQEGFVTTEALVQHFNVTPQTIRRDLNELDHQGKISRHHGGAGLPNSSIENTRYGERKHHLSAEKDRIAMIRLGHVADIDTLFTDAQPPIPLLEQLKLGQTTVVVC